MDSVVGVMILVVYFLMAAGLVIALGVLVSELLKHSWGRILVGVVVVVGFGYLGMKWMDADTDAASACRQVETAMAMARMYQYQADAGPKSAQAKSQMIDSCRQVLGGYNRYRNVTTVGERTWDVLRRTHFSEEAARAADFAAIEMLSKASDPADRLAARRFLRNGGDGSRLDSLLRHRTGSDSKQITDLAKDPVRERRVDAYFLASWYCVHGQYDKSLAKLEMALGDGWIRTGKGDEWCRENLLPGPEQHMWFGYVLYKSGHADRALQEFRSVYGANQTKNDMQSEYVRRPDLPM